MSEKITLITKEQMERIQSEIEANKFWGDQILTKQQMTSLVTLARSALDEIEHHSMIADQLTKQADSLIRHERHVESGALYEKADYHRARLAKLKGN